MKTMNVLVAMACAVAMVLSACGGEELSCSEDGELIVCGDVGTHLYSIKLATDGADVSWPPVALEDGRLVIARGNQVLHVSAQGQTSAIANMPGAIGVLSRGADGSLVAVADKGMGATAIKSLEPGSGAGPATVRFETTVAGKPAVQPAARQTKRVFVSMRGAGATPVGAVVTLDGQSGKQLGSQQDVSPVALMADGSKRQLAKGMANGAFRLLIARDANDKVTWTHNEQAGGGIIDFAPGRDGEVYIVTQQRTLRRVSPLGDVTWSFDAPCANCTVAGAPTITDTHIYFPVWETAEQTTWEAAPPPGMDPLYALRHDGTTDWVYDGFSIGGSSFNAAGLLPLSPAGSPVKTDTVQHHPAGRPSVAADGTLYVAADGGLTVLSERGQELGRVIHDQEAGEHVRSGNSLLSGEKTSLVGIATDTPVLGPDGTLYIWDGTNVHAFATGRKVAKAPWIAPFGGPDNASNVPK